MGQFGININKHIENRMINDNARKASALYEVGNVGRYVVTMMIFEYSLKSVMSVWIDSLTFQ